MRKKQGWYWIVTGTMLLTVAFFLVLHNFWQDLQGAETAQATLQEMREKISSVEKTNKALPEQLPEENLLTEYEEEQLPEEVLVEVDGRKYLGIISIPSLKLELPVLSMWSYPNLKISPCRYAGSVDGGDLIVAAHNYRSHFGKIGDLHTGDDILFTDGNGIVHSYEVIQTELIAGRDVPEMEDGAEEWDLTLFTCTLSGANRVTVRAAERQ